MINCVLINARSICNKLSEFHHLIYSNTYDLIFVCESWLTPNWPNGIIDPLHLFNIVRCDRSVRSGGGVCILIRKSLHYAEITTNSKFNSLELCGIDIVSKHARCRFICVYRPPGYGKDSIDYARLIAEYINTFTMCKHPVIILGDFNLPHIDWAHLTGPNDSIHNLLLDTFISNGLLQQVSEPTRITNILDIVLTNEPMIMPRLQTYELFGNSDHSQVQFCVHVANDHPVISDACLHGYFL